MRARTAAAREAAYGQPNRAATAAAAVYGVPIRRYRAVQQHMLRTDAHDTPTAVARVYRRTKARWLRKVAKGFIGGTLPTCSLPSPRTPLLMSAAAETVSCPTLQ